MINFDSYWEFKLEGEDEWEMVKIPHDWLIKDTNNLYKTSVGIYKKCLNLSESYIAGKHIFLNFDGVYQDSSLFINEKLVGEWKNGYTSFSFEITDFLVSGENEVVLRVNYEAPNSRWYSGAGIYRNVQLIVKNEAYFDIDSILVDTFNKENNWIIKINTKIMGLNDNFTVCHQVLLLDGLKEVETHKLSDSELLIKNPKVWDIESPTCYILKSQIKEDSSNNIIDEIFTRFGFREILFSPPSKFYLNGKSTKIKGVCMHHDLGALGAVTNKDALKRQMLILKEMGVNSIRTAHNPPSKEFMELCDTMGFLVMTELTDVWKRKKTEFDYARHFEKWIEKDIASWVQRDRNSPSIVLWSIGNEIYDTHADANDGKQITEFMKNEVLKHNPNAIVTFCSNFLEWENTQKSADILKLVGYNYSEKLYEKHTHEFKNWIIYGGETASTVQSRGIYHFPLNKQILVDDDLQCSSLGNSTTSWGARNTEAVINDHKNLLGQFLWTGFDYIGEPTPYSTKNSYFGQIDTAGFPKDSFYYFKAAWKNEPLIHLLPYWDYSLSQPIDVRVITNQPKVELFLNGKSLGIKEVKGEKLTANYVVPYEKGELKAVAYDNQNNIIASAIKQSFDDVKELKTSYRAIGDLTFVEIFAVDENGVVVENANSRVNISVESGTLLGLDNGDSTDFEQYQGTFSRRLFSDKLLAILEGNNPKISTCLDTKDIPIRKIELIQENSTRFKAITYPTNATYKNLDWRLADANGIDSPIATLKISDDTLSVKISPKGDGEVYVRCSAKNGKSHADIISVFPITLSGYGKPFLDPYSFISGGLYTNSNVQIGSGNERGAATPSMDETHIGFKDINFGSYSSDELTLWIFSHTSSVSVIEVYSGNPSDGGKLLCQENYDLGTVWDKYLPATYKLSEKLTGVHDIFFVFNDKLHFKGFQFKSKTYAQIPFTSCDKIYGDTFTIKKNAIENIGNNVSITFDSMNFEKETNEIKLCWRSKQDKNNVNIIFTDSDDKKIVNSLEPSLRNDYSESVFVLKNPLSGKGRIDFIFLPGSKIDLKYFKFIRTSPNNSNVD